MTWGYSRKGNIVGLRCALAEAMLASRSLHLPVRSKLWIACTSRLMRRSPGAVSPSSRMSWFDAASSRRRSAAMGRWSVGRASPIGAYSMASRSSGANGVSDGSRQPRCKPSSRVGGLYRLFNVGQWLAQSGYGSEPADWNREVAAAYVAAVDRSTIGQWSTVAGTQRLHTGQPLKPAIKAGALTALRRFFQDCQEWGCIPTRFNPYQALATPRSVRWLIGPDCKDYSG